MSRSFSQAAPDGVVRTHVDGALADLALGRRQVTPQELDALVPHLRGCERCQVALALLLAAQARDAALDGEERAEIEGARDEVMALIGAHDAAAHDDETRAAYAETLIARGEAAARARVPALARHLDRCPVCRDEIAELRAQLDGAVAAGIVAPITPRAPRPPAARADGDDRAIGPAWPAALSGLPSQPPSGGIHMQRPHSATMTLPPIGEGTRLTDFVTLDLAVQGTASGGMGLVAWGPNAAKGGQMTAVKLIRPDLLAGRSEDEQARLRADFEREALTWCHVWPHAAIIIANGLTRLPGWGNLPVLELEYAPGGNLRAALSRGHQPSGHLKLQTALDWAQQIAAGLAAIHTPDPDHERPHPLVHCDLKPENVLLNAQGWAKLTDLGLTRAYAAANASVPLLATDTSGTAADERQARIARLRAALIQAGLRPPDPAASPVPPTAHATLDAAALGTRSVRVPPLPTARAVGSRGLVAGTPPYMAPEQWLGMDAVGPATDVYALGVLLFELFAGVDAFPIVPDLHAALTEQDVYAAWYEAHRQGPRLTLSDPAVAALDEGPLNDLLGDAAGAARAREVLGELERLVAACLAGAMERRPSAEQVRIRLATLAQRASFEPLDISSVALRTPTSEADFWTNLGITVGKLGRREERLRLQRRAVELSPEDPTLWVNLGVANSELNQAEEALAAYQEAERRLTPEWVARYPALRTSLPNNLGAVLVGLRRYLEAVAAFQRALALAPDMADVHRNLAVTYLLWAEEAGASGEQRRERLRRALEQIEQALRLAPNLSNGARLRDDIAARLREVEGR